MFKYFHFVRLIKPYPLSFCRGLEKQRTIDEFTTEVKIPAFTKAGLMDYICELIVTTDEASCIFFAATPCL